MSKTLNDYTRKELLALPQRAWDKETIYDSLLVIPSNEKHDSGWAYINIIGVVEGKPTEIVTTCSDDIEWKSPAPKMYEDFALGQIRTDCAFKSKALNFWSREYQFKVGCALSSITVELLKKG